jgi:translation initiation factor 2B subunit (eIF-2B alpha/beta/delta family)
MAPLLHLADRALRAAQNLSDAESMREAVQRAAGAFTKELRAAAEQIARSGAGLAMDGATVVTVSYSSAVAGALLHARRDGRRLRVICPESRPLYEGRELARQLATSGVETTLVMDAAAPALVAQADLVLVGTDGVTAQALINKVGTYSLALAAQAHAVPLYALAGSEKFWPPGVELEIADRDPTEVWPEPVPGVAVVNRYFEAVPLAFFSGLVTSDGILPPDEVRQQVSALVVHPALTEYANRR